MGLLYFLGLSGAVILALQDIRYKKVNILIPGIIWAASLPIRFFAGEAAADMAACSFLGAMFIALSFITTGVGRGDGFVIGMAMNCLGFSKGIQVLCLSLMLMCIAALCLLVLKKAGLKTALPYVPWLMAAYIAGGILL